MVPLNRAINSMRSANDPPRPFVHPVVSHRALTVSCNEMEGSLIERYVDMTLSDEMDVAVRAHALNCPECNHHLQIREALEDLPTILGWGDVQAESENARDSNEEDVSL